MKTEPQKEHEWLQRLVGEWTYESECSMEPGKPPEKFEGSEGVRSLGGLWVLCEGRGEMPGGGMATTLMTLGYDPDRPFTETKELMISDITSTMRYMPLNRGGGSSRQGWEVQYRV